MSAPYAVVRAFVEPYPADAAATFAVSDHRTGDGNDPTATGRLVGLPAGDTVEPVRVTAEDGSHRNYVITIHRASS